MLVDSNKALLNNRTSFVILFALLWIVGGLSSPALAMVEEIIQGAPDLNPLTPHVVLPASLTAAQLGWPLDCSEWPATTPGEGYLASVFGHRISSGDTDFHRGMDLRCHLHGRTCCEVKDEHGNVTSTYCDQKTCNAGDTEVPAPIHALVGGDVKSVGDGTGNNNLVIETRLQAPDVIQVGDTTCDRLFIWYQHMRSPFAQPWDEQDGMPFDSVAQNEVLGWQGNSGANSVHLHLSIRACNNSRLKASSPPGYADPEINPFQLLGTDDGVAPTILDLNSEIDNTDVVVTVQIGTIDPDFDQLEISVYDADEDEHTVRRLGYNSRLGIDVINDIDSSTLEPFDLSELTTIIEPDPPEPSSGFTLEARFPGLDLVPHPQSRIQIKVADVFGNTSIQELPIFGPAVLDSAVLHLDSNTGLVLDTLGQVEQWKDVSGHGHDALQADVNQRPVPTTDGVHFATDTAMCIPHASVLNPQTFTVFMVFESLLERNYVGLLTTMHYGQREGWNLALRSENLQSDTFATSFQGNGTSAYQGNGGDVLLNTSYLVSMRHGDPGTHLTVDNAAPGTGYSNQLISYVPDTPLCLNYYYTDATSQLLRADANYKEVILFDTALSAADETAVADYLMDKWGISTP